jgi:hypothetical protein
MNLTAVERIAAAVLYEGYILYPYRASSTKNVQRWNFGTLYPEQYAEAQRPAETYRLQAECLVEADEKSKLDIQARFLQFVRRRAGTSQEWEEGIERSFELNDLSLSDLWSQRLVYPFTFHATDTVVNGEAIPFVSQEISGRLDIHVCQVRDGLGKLSLTLSNTTPVQDASVCSRKDAMLQAFVSAHLLLGIHEGKFVSLLETPEEFRDAAATCQNVGIFPVLVGEKGERSVLLCSPIILYDYPQVAPESAGDFFDGTEMDEMLALRVMTLTDEEKEEMRNVDDRARQILERTETLPPDFLMKVHGVIRGLRSVSASSNTAQPEVDMLPVGEWNPLTEKLVPETVSVFGTALKVGSRVRLWPQKKADIMDMALEGKAAVIEAIEQDFDDNIQLAVVVDDDPGREFGMMRQPGHRFFFSLEEVEPLDGVSAQGPL